MFIEDCIKSIQQQSFKSYEIIIVDDGSNDGSLEFCQSLHEKYSFALIHQDNSGPYNARITGIEHAIGEYLLFVDSDDMIRGDALEILYSTISQVSADIVFFNGSKQADYTVQFLNYPFVDGTTFTFNRKKELFDIICRTTLLNNLATKCIKKDLVDRADLERIDYFKNGEDLYFFIPLLDRAASVTYLDRNLYYYRQNEHSTTHNYNCYYYESVKRTNKRCIEYCEKWGLDTNVKGRVSLGCVSTVIHTMSSDLTDRQYQQEISKIYADDFFGEYIQYKPVGATKRAMIIYYIIKNKQFRRSKLINKVLRKLIT